MNKEEILAKSRQENKDKDLYELEIKKKTCEIGLNSAAIVCALLFVSEIIICGKTNFGLWSIITSVYTGSYIYRGIKLNKKGDIALGIIATVITLLMVGYTIFKFFTTSTIL